MVLGIDRRELILASEHASPDDPSAQNLFGDEDSEGSIPTCRNGQNRL
jgi:hypothetical protein